MVVRAARTETLRSQDLLLSGVWLLRRRFRVALGLSVMNGSETLVRRLNDVVEEGGGRIVPRIRTG